MCIFVLIINVKIFLLVVIWLLNVVEYCNCCLCKVLIYFLCLFGIIDEFNLFFVLEKIVVERNEFKNV